MRSSDLENGMGPRATGRTTVSRGGMLAHAPAMTTQITRLYLRHMSEPALGLIEGHANSKLYEDVTNKGS